MTTDMNNLCAVWIYYSNLWKFKRCTCHCS